MKIQGFVQVLTKMGSFFCKGVEFHQNFLELSGPMIVSLRVLQDEKTKQMQRLWNKDMVERRFIANEALIGVDVLEPSKLDKETKEIYALFSGIELV